MKEVWGKVNLYFIEGEGDRSLAYWRGTQEEFFTEEFKETEIEETHIVAL